MDMFEHFETPNEITERLSRAQLYQDFKLTCLNYYVSKGVLPNTIAKQKIMRRICKQYGKHFTWAERPLIDGTLSRLEKTCVTIGSFDLETIKRYEP